MEIEQDFRGDSDSFVGDMKDVDVSLLEDSISVAFQ